VSQPTFIVIESGPADAVARAAAELAARGARIASPAGAPAAFEAARPGQICAGEVTGAASAQRAVLAALAGAHVIVVASAPREVTDMLCEDLRRLGILEHRIGEVVAASPAAGARAAGATEAGRAAPGAGTLGETERALLSRLLQGDSLGDAAAALHLSRRTADRRLAAARQRLGAATTAEALASAVRLGFLP